MVYPKEFVEAVKAEYPDWEQLHRALDMGDTFVARYLDDSSSGSFSAKYIITMIDSGRVHDLRDEAAKIMRRLNLCSQWHKLYETAEAERQESRG